MEFVKRYTWPLLFLVLVVALGVGTFTSSGSKTMTQQQRVDHLASQIRCPTCAGLSVQQSESPLAESSKQEISSEVSAGRSDAQIKAYFVSRYGDTALMSPERKGFVWTAWLIPALVGLVLLAGVIFAVRKWGSSNKRTARPTELQRLSVEAALKR